MNSSNSIDFFYFIRILLREVAKELECHVNKMSTDGVLSTIWTVYGGFGSKQADICGSPAVFLIAILHGFMSPTNASHHNGIFDESHNSVFKLLPLVAAISLIKNLICFQY